LLNIPQEEGITTVCNANENFHKNNPPIPTNYIKEMLRLILKENSFQFNGKNYLQIQGTAMGTKMTVALATRKGRALRDIPKDSCEGDY